MPRRKSSIVLASMLLAVTGLARVVVFTGATRSTASPAPGLADLWQAPMAPLTQTAQSYLPLMRHRYDLVSFTHGVASGDVSQDSAILWTRASREAQLTVEVADEPAFASLVFQAPVMALAADDGVARVRVPGLSSSQTYFYRFRHMYAVSEMGTFGTPPDPATTRDVRFAYSGDSDGTPVGGQPFYNHFEVLDAARGDSLDFFVYLGDTIYADSSLRSGGPATTLEGYWGAYRANREVPALPALLAAAPLYAIWDDHEVQNDYSGQTADQALYANGRQAFLTYMPLDDQNLPADPSCAGDPLFRVFHWGQEVDVVVLDERSCRSAPVGAAECPFLGTIPDLAPTAPASIRVQFGLPPSPPAGCLEALNDPARTLLGAVQKQRFLDFLASSTARFKFVVNEVPIQQFYALPYDRWEGYAAERAEILNFIRDRNIQNVVFLTADTHANLINEVFIDDQSDPQTIAYELVTGPIATNTMQQQIVSFLGQDGLDAFNSVLDEVGVDCRHLNAYAYGLVAVDASSGQATISLKDDQGVVLVDQLNPAVTCSLTLGP